LSNKTSSTKNAYKKAIEYLLKEYEQDRTVKNHPICTNLLNAEEINLCFDLLDTTDKKTKTIIQDLKTSWNIYQLNRTDRPKSFIERGKLMNRYFPEFYEKNEKTKDIRPKVLIEMGAMHAMRGKTPLGIYDIGETVSNLAIQNGSENLNLFSFLAA
jgi:hypothetical protein